MLDILSYIKKRNEIPIINARKDIWAEKIIASELQDEFFFITSEWLLCIQKHAQREALLEKYHIAGVYDLGRPYTNTKINMYLVQLVSKKVTSVNMSVYTGETFHQRGFFRRERGCDLVLPEVYSPEYSDYIKILEDWINKGINPDQNNEGKFEFNVIPIENIDFSKLYPRYYTRKAIEVRKLVEKDCAFKLSEVADVLLPRQIRDSKEKVKVLLCRNFTYPLDIDSLDMMTPTNIQLQKNDILFPTIGGRSPFLYNIDSKEPIYAKPSYAVIRCKSILPEYLFFYLNSEVAVCLREMVSQGAFIQKISLRDISNLPITKPNFDDKKYINDFDIISNVSGRNYGNREQNIRLKSYYGRLEAIIRKQAAPKHLEDIIDIELAQKIKLQHEEQVRTLLEDDLKELNTCFAHKAYKAALILAGSILEAVLIDWLSEIDSKNYFEEEYKYFDRRENKYKRADLAHYIDEIKYIKRPEWMEEANKAHEIRKKRNLVHAKLCMKEDVIDEESCKQVIEYLRDVLRTRGVSSDSKLKKSKK